MSFSRETLLAMAYWILKTDPESFAFERLAREGAATWDGVRNFRARNHLASMASGDQCLVYETGATKAVVGTAHVTRGAYPEPGADDKRWVCVDIQVDSSLPAPVLLGALQRHPALTKLAILRQSRLSVAPVSPGEWAAILELAGVAQRPEAEREGAHEAIEESDRGATPASRTSRRRGDDAPPGATRAGRSRRPR